MQEDNSVIELRIAIIRDIEPFTASIAYLQTPMEGVNVTSQRK